MSGAFAIDACQEWLTENGRLTAADRERARLVQEAEERERQRQLDAEQRAAEAVERERQRQLAEEARLQREAEERERQRVLEEERQAAAVAAVAAREVYEQQVMVHVQACEKRRAENRPARVVVTVHLKHPGGGGRMCSKRVSVSKEWTWNDLLFELRAFLEKRGGNERGGWGGWMGPLNRKDWGGLERLGRWGKRGQVAVYVAVLQCIAVYRSLSLAVDSLTVHCAVRHCSDHSPSPRFPSPPFVLRPSIHLRPVRALAVPSPCPSPPLPPVCHPPTGNRFKADVGDDVTKGSAFVVTGRGPGLEQGQKQLTSCDQLTSGMEGEI
jgi:hypothetical protein